MVLVTLTRADWCWESSQLTAIVIKGEQTPLKFNQTGYSMKYEVSHDTAVVSHPVLISQIETMYLFIMVSIRSCIVCISTVIQ